MAHTEQDFAAAGLLDGLDGPPRAARLRLLERLDDAGFPLTELRSAAEDGLLPFLLAEREVSGPLDLSQREVAERSGLPLPDLRELRRAMGLPLPDPDDREFGEGDVELASTLRGLKDAGVPLPRLAEVSRLMGRGLGPVAEVMRATALEQALDPDLPEDELAAAFQARASALLPFIGPALLGSMRLLLREMVASEVAAAMERGSGGLPGARPITVAFADLTGFTRLGEQLDPGELGAVAARLSTLLTECAGDGVRVVKELGDGAMLVAPQPAPLVRTGLALVEAAANDETLPDLRVGIAAGPAVHRAGDWFGRPVNLASRVCGVARPASVLATREVRDAVSDVHWSSAGPRHLKGVSGETPLFRARREAATPKP